MKTDFEQILVLLCIYNSPIMNIKDYKFLNNSKVSKFSAVFGLYVHTKK